MKTGQLNILCIGELTAGKSTFLQFYTNSDHTEQHYKIFARRQSIPHKMLIIYLHQIQQKIGIDVYLDNQYDAILFFVRIDDFHNTRNNVVECLSLYSQVSGTNIYKIPIKMVAISSKRGQQYDDITYNQKSKLQQEVRGILDEDQIIYVQSDRNIYQAQLNLFYNQILKDEARGIRESFYSNWQTRGILNFVFPNQLMLQFRKLSQEIKFSISQKMIYLNLIKKKKV